MSSWPWYDGLPESAEAGAGGPQLFQVHIDAVAVGVATLTTQAKFFKILAPVAVGVPVLSKKMFVTLSATAVGQAVMTKKMFKTLAATAVGQVTLATRLTAKRTLAAVAVGIATLATQFIAGAGGAAKRILHSASRRHRRKGR